MVNGPMVSNLVSPHLDRVGLDAFQMGRSLQDEKSAKGAGTTTGRCTSDFNHHGARWVDPKTPWKSHKLSNLERF